VPAAIAAATGLVVLAILLPPGACVGVRPRELARTLGSGRRRREADESIIPALESIAAASRAGSPLRDALALALERARTDLRDRISAALARERLGDPLDGALAAARDGASPAVDAVLADVELAAGARLGAERVAALFEESLLGLRFEREVRRDLVARTAGQRFQIWLLAAVVPALALYLSAMSPTLADELASPLGHGVLIPAGALFEIAGILLSRRILERACR